MTTRGIRRAAATLAAGGVLLAGWPQPAAGEETGPAPAVAEAAAEALVKSAWPNAIVDYTCAAGQGAAGEAVPVAYRTDRVVLRGELSPDEAAEQVRAALRHTGGELPVAGVETLRLATRPGVPDPAPVTVVTLDPRAGRVPPIVAVAQRLRETGTPASPDYLLSPSSGPTAMWPGGPPEPAPGPVPGRAAGTGAGVRILVYDAGLPSPAESAHPPNVSRLHPDDVERLDQRAPFGVVDTYYAGHAVAIADVVNTLAPGAQVKVARITGPDGVPTDATAARRMSESLRRANQLDAWPDLIVNAFGAPACDGLAPLGLDAVAEAVQYHGRALLIASAGNRGSDRPFYPAGFGYPRVVTVGALDATEPAGGDPAGAWTDPSRSGTPAGFSNHGTWVDAWAPGVDLTARHLTGVRFSEEGPVIDGLATVDGTSFAAPYLTALIAEEMAASGVDAGTAWARLAAAGTRCSAAVGGGVAVTLVGLGATAVTRADGNAAAGC